MTAVPARFFPYGRQHIGDDDIAAVAEVLRGDWLTTGPTVAAFEAALCAATGAAHAVARANGTAALHLVALALGLAPGDRAIVRSVTFLAPAHVWRLAVGEVRSAARRVGKDGVKICITACSPSHTKTPPKTIYEQTNNK